MQVYFEIITIGDITPLVRITLILRKFQLGIVRVEMTEVKGKKGSFKLKGILDCKKCNRPDIVFKKIARLYDVDSVKLKIQD